jgi:hypothetical protein
MNREIAKKNNIHHRDTEGTEKNGFWLAFGQKKKGESSVISVPLTSDSEWVVKNEFTTEQMGG